MNDGLNEQALLLLACQKSNWPLAAVNYAALSQVVSRIMSMQNVPVCIQFNPERYRSITAKVDAAAIAARPCFLCAVNRPDGQQSVPFGKNYEILVNPFPIFPQHLTNPLLKHEPQAIRHRFGDLLELADQLTDFVVFYNGPQSGASAPDHHHFQAGNRGLLPIEQSLNLMEQIPVLQQSGISLYLVNHYLMPLFVFDVTCLNAGCELFDLLYQKLPLLDGDYEPRMNILAWKTDQSIRVCVIPRKKLRPDCYYATGEDRLLISPASVEVGGLIVLSYPHDYEQLTPEKLKAVFDEVCYSSSELRDFI